MQNLPVQLTGFRRLNYLVDDVFHIGNLSDRLCLEKVLRSSLYMGCGNSTVASSHAGYGSTIDDLSIAKLIFWMLLRALNHKDTAEERRNP